MEHVTTIEATEPSLLTLLSADRGWSAYALCDLEPSYLPYCHFLGSWRDRNLNAVLFIFASPGFTAISAHGTAGVDVLLAAALTSQMIPVGSAILARQSDLPVYAQRLTLGHRTPLVRMVLSAERFEPRTCPPGFRVRRLTDGDLPALDSLYASWPETVFNRFMFAEGVYFGAFVTGALVAAAGTHAVSNVQQIAMVGNVFTAPAQRGKRLAEATTSAVVAELFRAGVRDVALNVKAENAPAIAVYARLGFRQYLAFVETRVLALDQRTDH